LLNYLKINNVALVEELVLRFGRGLNVITGETGAGKSILIGSIALTLGDRAHPDIVREKKATVEASFELNGIAKTLVREVGQDGRTKARIDNQAATITALKQEGRRWIELTAQRDGATLLDPASHLEHIDRFAGLESDVNKLRELFASYQELKGKRAALSARIKRMQETEELANYQLAEIESFDPKLEEEAELEREIRLLEGAETLLLGLGKSVDELDQGSDPVSDRIAGILQEIQVLARIDDSLNDQHKALTDVVDILRQTSQDLSNRRDGIQLDPERLDEQRTRHGQLIRLIRKYGGSMEALLETWESLRTRENDSADLLKQRDRLNREIHNHLEAWEVVCENVSAARTSIIPQMQDSMEEGLRSVGVEKPRFEIHRETEEGESIDFPNSGQHRVTPEGWNRLEFRISFNPGHELKALHRVASGGELSRMMLLLRGLNPPEGLPPVLVFDEVDTGISGKTARQVGLRLKELSRIRQVILVTHLPQIASLADQHFVMEKRTFVNSTTVEMRELPVGSQEQVDEVARLLGGEHISDGSRAAAKELIQV
jgi:DNA repair protein RecN (Recombination protein N)